ncbi:endonuclease III domain-containing protein [Candidatus Palauibacter sp.]|uniref:endonuclease III domain-containing protein n=1 Tax=Candidatus Palauibacter sp. TaxID=3101350 RepID=UPI003AF2BD3B
MSSAPDTPRSPDVDVVLRRLSERLSIPDKPRLAPLDELVLTILSQSTTDENRDRAWRSLARRFPRSAQTNTPVAPRGSVGPGPICWESVRRATPEQLEDAIRVAGLANQKVPAIRNALERLAAEVGRLSLDHLRDMDDGEAIAYLTTFRGVGVKTAACVLCFSLRRPVLPVDTHVLRIARRLAWVPPKASADHTYQALARRVPADERFRMHMLLITFGRSLCVARTPRCEACPLGSDCPKVGVPPRLAR